MDDSLHLAKKKMKSTIVVKYIAALKSDIILFERKMQPIDI